MIENVQRVDVHPLDEARGYAALIEIEPDTYTVETISARVGRSPAYLSGRLRLIQLIPEAKQAFYEEKLTVAHAFEIARLQPLCGGVSYLAFGQCFGGPALIHTLEQPMEFKRSIGVIRIRMRIRSRMIGRY